MDDASLRQDPLSSPPAWTPGQHWIWLGAQVSCLLMLAALGWLLARLIWLFYFFGLFFFLVAGLLVGAISFRLARGARPVEKSRLVRGILLISLWSTLITINWEYRHFSATVGQPPKFAGARNAAVSAGRGPSEIRDRAEDAFKKYLAADFSPGGAVGYVLWAVKRGEARLSVDSNSETITISHRHWIWPIRTLAGALLLAAGLWFGMESLRSALPVTNLIRPGEEAEDDGVTA